MQKINSANELVQSLHYLLKILLKTTPAVKQYVQVLLCGLLFLSLYVPAWQVFNKAVFTCFIFTLFAAFTQVLYFSTILRYMYFLLHYIYLVNLVTSTFADSDYQHKI